MAAMDRIREDRPNPTWRKIRRMGGAGLLILAVVLGVSLIPVLVLSFWMEPSAPGPAGRNDSMPADSASRIETMFIPSGDIRLSATLHLPSGDGPYPALALVHGSGRIRGADMAGFGRYFAQHGIAALAYDKRGVGRSDGEYSGVGVENSQSMLTRLAEDVRSVVSYLHHREDLRPNRIGLLGFSQAGWIIPIAAAASSQIAFTVLVSGPTVSVGEEIYYSELTGDDLAAPSDLSGTEIRTRLADYAGARGFDPVPFLRRMRQPGLWMFGGQDRSIPVAESIGILEELIQRDRLPFQYRLFPNGDHGLRDASVGQPIPFLDEVLAWLQDQDLLD